MILCGLWPTRHRISPQNYLVFSNGPLFVSRSVIYAQLRCLIRNAIIVSSMFVNVKDIGYCICYIYMVLDVLAKIERRDAETMLITQEDNDK